MKWSNGMALQSTMDNVLAYRLGKIVRVLRDEDIQYSGDDIDRGLILRRLLEESGFEIREIQ